MADVGDHQPPISVYRGHQVREWWRECAWEPNIYRVYILWNLHVLLPSKYYVHPYHMKELSPENKINEVDTVCARWYMSLLKRLCTLWCKLHTLTTNTCCTHHTCTHLSLLVGQWGLVAHTCVCVHLCGWMSESANKRNGGETIYKLHANICDRLRERAHLAQAINFCIIVLPERGYSLLSNAFWSIKKS